jgi:hypothetical protein
MPITPYLRGQAFDPEMIKVMGDAFTEVRGTLGLKDREDKLVELVARRIIELAQQGVKTKTALYLMTVQEFKSNPH